MGSQHSGQSQRQTDDNAIEWGFDSDGSSTRMAGPADANAVDDLESGEVRSDAAADAGRHPHVRRWASKLAGAALISLVVLGLVRAFRGDRTHRLIQIDVQNVVQLEAQALADGDRELFMSVQDLTRRRMLRRPDIAADVRRADGPVPGAFFTDDPPLVGSVEVAAKDAAHTVEAVTATVQVAATDGAHVGRFEQVRRMARNADGHWLHAASPEVRRTEDVERFVSSRIHASFPAVDGPLLRPLLEQANAAVQAFCVDQGRCTGRARLAFGSVDDTAADVAFRLTAPSPPSGWQPVDEAARAMLALGIARAAALRLDYAFDDAVRPGGAPSGSPAALGPDTTIVTALLDAKLAAHLSPSAVEAWAADTTATELGLTLWHFGPRFEQPLWNEDARRGEWRGLPRRDRTIAARNFAAMTLRRDPARFAELLATWPEVIAGDVDAWLSSRSIEREFGPRGLSTVLGWPRPQAPFIPDGAVVLTCDEPSRGTYVAGRTEGIADLSMLACGGDQVSSTAWSPNGSALAVACFGNASQAEPIPWESRGMLALVRRDSTNGWSTALAPPSILPATGTFAQALSWAPDGRHLAIDARTWSYGGYQGDEPPSHVRLVAVDHAAVAPWTPPTELLPLPAVLHPLTDEPVRPLISGPRLAWSPDGRMLAVAGRDGQITLQPASGGPATLLSGLALAWSPDGSRILRLVGAEDGVDPAAGVTKGTLALSVVDAGTMTETLRIQLSADSVALRPDRRFHPVPAGDVNAVLSLAWSDDGQWIGAAFLTSTRCGDAVYCAVGFAWQPGTGVLRQVVNAPQEGRRGRGGGWPWRGAWVPGTARYAVFSGDEDAMGDEGELAFVLDAPTGEVETVARSARASLTTLLPNFSPDGRWHARLDAMRALVVERTNGIGGYQAGDEATGWRFNRPFCWPQLLWSTGRQ